MAESKRAGVVGPGDAAGARRANSFPFIVGAGRSGTTLLRSMLDSHPQLAIPPETGFLTMLMRRRWRYDTPRGFKAATFLRDLTSAGSFRVLELGPAEVEEALAVERAASLADGVRAVYGAYAAKRGKPMYGEKTPRYVEVIPRIARLFPESRFIHVIRDGRDVALSRVEFRYGASTMLGAARNWRRSVNAGRRAGGKLGPTRYIEVRYEQLVADPERELRVLAEFIGIPFDPAMLDYRQSAEGWVSAVRNPEQHSQLFAAPKSKRDWRTEMAPHDLATFESVAGRLLGELGYERASDAPSALQRVGTGAAEVADEVGFQIKRMRVHGRRTWRRLGGARRR